MLVTFSCDAYENITLFGHVAQRLLSMMGHSGVVPSAILADDVPTALHKLEIALNQVPKLAEYADDEPEDEISLDKRALPVIGLLKAAIKDHCDVMIT